MSRKRESGGAQSEIWAGHCGAPLGSSARPRRSSTAKAPSPTPFVGGGGGARGAARAALGVGLGGRVGFLGVNSLAHVECWLGVPAFGRVMVDLNFRLAEPELAFMVDDCELEVLIVDRDQLEVGRALRQRCPNLRELILDGTGDCPTDCVP